MDRFKKLKSRITVVSLGAQATLEEMKNYLRVDFEDDDRLIEGLIRSGQKMCMDILRTDDPAVLENPDARTAVLYAAAYQYEHRE